MGDRAFRTVAYCRSKKNGRVGEDFRETSNLFLPLSGAAPQILCISPEIQYNLPSLKYNFHQIMILPSKDISVPGTVRNMPAEDPQAEQCQAGSQKALFPLLQLLKFKPPPFYGVTTSIFNGVTTSILWSNHLHF